MQSTTEKGMTSKLNTSMRFEQMYIKYKTSFAAARVQPQFKCILVSNLRYQPSGEEGTCSLPAMPHRLQNPKWPPGGPKMAEGVWKGVYPQVFGYSKQLSLNKFFDPSIPSMRKGRDGEKKKGGGKWMKIVATTSLQAVDRPNADRWNAARSRRQKFKALVRVFQGCSVFESLFLHATHCSYPSRRRACF